NSLRVRTTLNLDGSLNRAETLLDGQTFHHDPLYYIKATQEQLAVTPADVERVAKQYLTPGRIVLSMVPAGKLDEIANPAAPYTNVTPKPEMQASAPATSGR
ncbi:MAG TPA: hypothetical protein VNU46_07040, partial [Gemmatimonadaceae bacterium]|nr:hypothetical protein [Gemmatimonadaceae bacterium]